MHLNNKFTLPHTTGGRCSLSKAFAGANTAILLGGLLAFSSPSPALAVTDVTAAISVDVFSADPGKFFAANDYLVISNLYESLYGHDEKDNLVPALATAVEMKDVGKAVSDPDRPIISGGQAETLVFSCCHVGADLAVARHSTRIRHKDTRFSGHVRAEIP